MSKGAKRSHQMNKMHEHSAPVHPIIPHRICIDRYFKRWPGRAQQELHPSREGEEVPNI